MSDDEGQEAEIFVPFGVDFRLRAAGGPVVAEHAGEGWGAGCWGEGDAGGDEGGEDGRVELEGVRDCGDDFLQ